MIEWLVEMGRYWMSLPLTRILAVIADFGLIALLIYGVLYFLRGTRSANVLFGITTFLAIAALLANLLELTVVSALLSGLWPILGTAIIVIFQPEIRRFFAEAGGIFASLGMVFPSLVIICIIAGVLSNFSDLTAVKSAFAGIRVCVCVLIFNAVIKLWKKAVPDKAALIIFLLVFVLSVFFDISPVIFVIVCAFAGIIIKNLGGKP